MGTYMGYIYIYVLINIYTYIYIYAILIAILEFVLEFSSFVDCHAVSIKILVKNDIINSEVHFC